MFRVMNVEPDLQRDLDEIFERMSHSDMSARRVGPTQTCILMADAKAIYERLHPEATAGAIRARGSNRKQGRVVDDNVSPTFASEVEKGTGIGLRDVQRLLRWGARIDPEVLREVEGTKFDKKVCLADLASTTDPILQKAKLQRWLSPDVTMPMPAKPARVDGWWSGMPGIIDTGVRFCIPGVIDLHLGDSLIIIPTLADKFDAAIFDPPFGIGYKGARGDVAGDENVEVATRGIPLIAGKLKDESFLVSFTRADVEWSWVRRLTAKGLVWRGQKIWVKDTSTLVGGRGAVQRNQHENIIIASKGEPQAYQWHDVEGIARERGAVIKLDSSVYSHAVPRDSIHPTPKPVELCGRLVRSYSPPSGLVLDPFMGCGPFAVAAIRTGRRYIGIEMDPRYFAVAVQRVQEALAERGPCELSAAA